MTPKKNTAGRWITYRATLSGLPLECVGNADIWNGWSCPIMTAEQVESFACMVTLYASAGYDAEGFTGEPAPFYDPRTLFYETRDGFYECGMGMTFEVEGIHHNDTGGGFIQVY